MRRLPTSSPTSYTEDFFAAGFKGGITFDLLRESKFRPGLFSLADSDGI